MSGCALQLQYPAPFLDILINSGSVPFLDILSNWGSEDMEESQEASSIFPTNKIQQVNFCNLPGQVTFVLQSMFTKD